MSTERQSYLKAFTRGGQITFHNWRMFGQINGKIFGFAFMATLVLLCIPVFYLSFTEENFGFVWRYFMAKFFLMFGDFFADSKISVIYHGNGYTTTYAKFISDPYVLWVMNAFWHRILYVVLGGIIIFMIIAYAFARWLTAQGRKQVDEQFIRGTELASNLEYEAALEAKKKASDITLPVILNPGKKSLNVHQMPLPKDFELQHAFFHGTTGAGKSQALMHLLAEIRRRGDKAIIFDDGNNFLPHFFKPETDKYWFPMDERSVNWHLWKECKTSADFANFARYLIPDTGNSQDPYWKQSARTIVASAAYTMQDDPKRSIDELLRLLILSDLTELSSYLADTEAQSMTSKSIEKTSISIRSVMTNYIKSLKYLKGLDNRPAFSVREWVRDPNENGFFFIGTTDQYKEELRSLITMLFAFAIDEIKSLRPDYNRRIWIIIDELPTLNRIEALEDGITKTRKYGGCFVLGATSYVQLERIYGDKSARALFDLFNTLFFFRNPSGGVAKFISGELGEIELEDLRENYSYGANSIRDGISLGKQTVVKPLVSYSEIMQMDDLTCYLKSGKELPITKLHIQPVYSRKEYNPPFLPREIPVDKEVEARLQRFNDVVRQDIEVSKKAKAKKEEIKEESAKEPARESVAQEMSDQQMQIGV